MRFVIVLLAFSALMYAGEGELKWKFQTGGDVTSSPAIGSDGTIYVGSDDNYLYAIESSSKGLANSPWPKFHHDNFNTGRAGGGGAIEESPQTPANLSVNASIISGRIQISITLPEGQVGLLQVYNVSGQRLAQTTVTSSGQKEFSQPFSRGVYLVRLESKTRTAQTKVVVL